MAGGSTGQEGRLGGPERSTTSRVCVAISHSSSVGTTSTATSLPSGETARAPPGGPALRTVST